MKRLVMYFIFCAAVSFPLNAQDSSRVKIRRGEEDTLKSITSFPGQRNVQRGHGRRFVDKNGDGYNDNAPDHDGDGIPNGLDPDYNGSKKKWGKRGFVDADGDGINDNAGGRGNRGRHSGHGKAGQKTGDAENTGARYNPEAGAGSRQNGLSTPEIIDSSKSTNKGNES